MRIAQLAIALLFAFSLAACTEHGKGGQIDGGGTPGSSDGGGSGRMCGGFGNLQCGASEFCDFDRNGCGASDESGVCHERPTGCPDNLDPVCGCDGQVHSNSCDAFAAGVDVNANGSCPVEQGRFACGFRTCNVMTEYCQRAASDIGNEPDQFTCKPLPGCPSQFPTCSCLANETCGGNCTGSGATGLTVTCLGG